MPTLSELILKLVLDEPMPAADKRQVALHLTRLIRRAREAERVSANHDTRFRKN